jgi:hypothetical protein
MMRPSTRWGRELASAAASWFLPRSLGPRARIFQRRPSVARQPVALFHDERRRAPMAMVASCRSPVDDDMSASPTTTRTSFAYPKGNGRGIIDKLSSSRRRMRRFPQLAAANRPCNAAMPKQQKEARFGAFRRKKPVSGIRFSETIR